MQESEIKSNLNHNFLSFPGYNIETETNSMNSRVAAYINTAQLPSDGHKGNL